jgi:hypothetical protein
VSPALLGLIVCGCLVHGPLVTQYQNESVIAPVFNRGEDNLFALKCNSPFTKNAID